MGALEFAHMHQRAEGIKLDALQKIVLEGGMPNIMLSYLRYVKNSDAKLLKKTAYKIKGEEKAAAAAEKASRPPKLLGLKKKKKKDLQ